MMLVSVIVFYILALLGKAMDPPNPEVIDDALSMLLSIQALRKSHRGRYEPTFYGRLLASFPLSYDASILVVKFGEMGMLREGILLGVLMDTQPLPINHPFGDDAQVFPLGELSAILHAFLIIILTSTPMSSFTVFGVC